MTRVQREHVGAIVTRFVAWLERFGETSFDHQSFYAGPVGRRAKELYYRRPVLGKWAVAPMVFSEAFFPTARKLFWHKMRLPISDAHYAMGFALMYRRTGDNAYYQRAVDFLNTLIETRCPDYAEFCWGYPFDWVTQQGTVAKGTPLITTTPYVYEALDLVYAIDQEPRWLDIMQSIAEHATNDIEDRPLSADIAAAGYCPGDAKAVVINASAYKACLLAQAAARFGEKRYRTRAEKNLNFVLSTQQPDGSWPYAVDGPRDFIDHFHTCFILKALAKIIEMSGHAGCQRALESGLRFYLRELFDQAGLPRPFSKPPRLTVYRQELYDYAECINLATLLRGRSEELDERLHHVIADLLKRWHKADGSFRSRRLLAGWDNVPMHRWGQSQMFRSLNLFLSESISSDKPRQ